MSIVDFIPLGGQVLGRLGKEPFGLFIFMINIMDFGPKLRILTEKSEKFTLLMGIDILPIVLDLLNA